LPRLYGSDRQVAYAEIVRAKKLHDVEGYITSWPSLPKSRRKVMEQPAREALRAIGAQLSESAKQEVEALVAQEGREEALAVAGVMERLRLVSLAEWWIDRRRWPPQQIITEVLAR
jgi:hypothetical protein